MNLLSLETARSYTSRLCGVAVLFLIPSVITRMVDGDFGLAGGGLRIAGAMLFGVSLFMEKTWARRLAAALLALTGLVLIAVAVHPLFLMDAAPAVDNLSEMARWFWILALTASVGLLAWLLNPPERKQQSSKLMGPESKSGH